MNKQINCPVDGTSIDENRVRLVAFLVIIISGAYLVTANWVLPAFLIIDFTLRGFGLTDYSVLSRLSGVITHSLKLKSKPVDRAPKRFAAFTGAVFSVFILVSQVAGLQLLTGVLSGILISFAALEAFAGFCAGCYVYSLLKSFSQL